MNHLTRIFGDHVHPASKKGNHCITSASVGQVVKLDSGSLSKQMSHHVARGTDGSKAHNDLFGLLLCDVN